jgi:hypothetical protein
MDAKGNTMTQEEQKMCALEYNIKNKGETSYYYAHKSKYENNEANTNAQTITGPGIITGGNPVLLQSEKKKVEIIKETKNITDYVFYDDDKIAIVKIILPLDAQDVQESDLEYVFDSNSFKLKINVINGEPYFFSVNKLYAKIDKDKSTCKIVKTKNGRTIKISFAKINIDDEWTKVSA